MVLRLITLFQHWVWLETFCLYRFIERGLRCWLNVSCENREELEPVGSERAKLLTDGSAMRPWRNMSGPLRPITQTGCRHSKQQPFACPITLECPRKYVCLVSIKHRKKKAVLGKILLFGKRKTTKMLGL